MSNKIKLAVLIPDRGDRPKLMRNCLRMMAGQSVLPDHLEIVNFDPQPNNQQPDITERYRVGYEKLRGKGFDVIALIENDDWYATDYLETMVREWNLHSRPDLFGTAYTIYYHLKLKAWFTMNHSLRSSAMNTLIKPDLNFAWCPDTEPYTDMHLWMTALKDKGIVWKPSRHISIGMKHGEGLCGGRNHYDKLHRFKNIDLNLSFLRETLDAESFKFYSNYYQPISV